MRILATVPLLRIFDVAQAKAFYVDFLGFKVDWEHQFDPRAPVYLQISRGACVLHLTGHHGDCCPGATVLVAVQGVDALHAELSAKDYPHCRPGVEHAPWNAKVMEVTDPFGNRLRFNEDLGARDA